MLIDLGINFFEWAQRLHVVDVHKAGNETGWVTPPVLYDPSVKADDGREYAPVWQPTIGWIDHGTAGSNTLRFWGEGGSVKNRAWSLAHYLVPHNTTMYADKQLHNTTYTVFKMVPPRHACNHVGIAINAPFYGANTIGMEYESMQDGSDDISIEAYIKGALVYCYDAAINHIPDHFRLSHGIVAQPWGRRTDPWSGKFHYARSWSYVQAIRSDPRIWAFWGLPQPAL